MSAAKGPKDWDFRERSTVIFFADLVGSSAVSSERGAEAFYNDYVRWFYQSIEKANEYMEATQCVKATRRENKQFTQLRPEFVKYRGDELVGFIPFCKADPAPSDEAIKEAVADVVRFLYAVKLLWLGMPYNLSRLQKGLGPRNISAGMHFGPVAYVKRGRRLHDLEVGYAINLAKRVEGSSRGGGWSHLFGTAEVRYWYERWREGNCKDVDPLKAFCFGKLEKGSPDHFKGIDPLPEVAELLPDRSVAGGWVRELCLGSGERATSAFNNLRTYTGVPIKDAWCKAASANGDVSKEFLKAVRRFSNPWLRTDLLLLALATAEKVDNLRKVPMFIQAVDSVARSLERLETV